nr:helix-turn-helix domain-containing protein [Bordetella pertussis]
MRFPPPARRHDHRCTEDSPLFVAALARGLTLLAAFSEGRPAMTLPELAEATGLTKSAAQRFAHTLWTLGYLRKNPDSKKFSLSPQSLQLGMQYAQTSPLVLGGNPFLHSLNRTSQETCSLAEPDGLDMVYVRVSPPTSRCSCTCRWACASRCIAPPPAAPCWPGSSPTARAGLLQQSPRRRAPPRR